VEVAVRLRIPLLSACAFFTGISGAGGQISGSFEPAGEGLPLFRESGGIAVIAMATPDWVVVPVESRDLFGDYQFIPSDVTARARGQVFRVLESEADWKISDDAGLFVAVPWTLGCGCAEVGWQEPVWVPSGDTVAFLLTPTRASGPRGGPPVYDVLGWHQPYPVGEFIPYWRTTRKENPDWLSVREFFDLLQVLPSEVAFQLNPESSLQGFLEWVEGHPNRSQAFPVETILSEWRRATGQLPGGSGAPDPRAGGGPGAGNP
jgi:hypothetical protein